MYLLFFSLSLSFGGRRYACIYVLFICMFYMGIYHIYVQYSALVLMSYKLAFPWSARILEKPFGKGFRPRVLGQCASVRNLWIPDEGICVPGSGSLA